MLHRIKGNLLESYKDGIQYIGHQSNCVMGFGSGIALQIRQNLPGAARVFYQDGREPNQKLGTFTVATEMIGEFDAVYNLYGQLECGTDKCYTVYQALGDAIVAMVEDIKYANAEPKIGLPWLIGCGLAGGDWAVVYEMLEKISEKEGVDFYLYEYQP